MQPSINEAIICKTLETEDLLSLPNRMASLIAEKLSLDCVGLYAGDQSLQKLLGLFIEENSFKIALDQRNVNLQSLYDKVDGIKVIDIPQSINGLNLRKREVKIYGFPFYFISDSLAGRTLTIAYSCDKRKVKRTVRELKRIFLSLHLALFSFLKLKEEFYESGALNDALLNKFLCESSTIKGYLNFYLKLLVEFLMGEYATIRVNAFNEIFSSEIGNSELTLDSTIEFEFGKNGQIQGNLKVASNKPFLNTARTSFLVYISLDYLKEIILNFNEKNFKLTAKLNNFYLFSKIYELFIEGKVGYFDRAIENTIFIGEKLRLSQAELDKLYWLMALKNIGKAIIRCVSKSSSKTFEEEFNNVLSSKLTKYIVGESNSKFDEIIYIAEEFTKLIDRQDEDLLNSIERLRISKEIEMILIERVNQLLEGKCFIFMQCPSYLRKSCPAFVSQAEKCFEVDNNLCYYLHSITCKDCLIFKTRSKEKVG